MKHISLMLVLLLTATGAATLIVPPERRGFAISVVVAGMTVSTALGAPIGTMIGSLGN